MSEKIALGVKLEPEVIEIFNKYGQLHGLNSITAVFRYIAATHCRQVLNIQVYTSPAPGGEGDIPGLEDDRK